MKDYFSQIEEEIIKKGLNVISKDFERPWGGFLVIDENQSQKFSNAFFDGISLDAIKIGGRLSPKILIVKPNARLSWQYHKRRAELWRIFKGSAGIIKGD